MNKPKKKKLLKIPKAPKKTASKTSWDNFEKKVIEVKKRNKKIIQEYDKARKEYEREMKRRAAILEKARKAV